MSFSAQMTSIETLLFAGRALLLVASFVIAAVAFTRWRRTAERDTHHVTSQLQLIAERLASLDERISVLDQRVGELSARLTENGQPAASAGSASSYSIAIRLARAGASREELMENCGITAAEADLMRRLHGASKRPLPGQRAAA